jgi:signal transduction histidine kinase
MTALRTRLLLGTSLSMSLILLAAGVAVYSFVRSSLVSEFDGALLSEARAIQATTERNERGRVRDPEAGDAPEFSRRERPDYFQIWLDDKSPAMGSQSLAGKSMLLPATVSDQPVFQSISLPDGKPGREISFRFVPRQEEEWKAPLAIAARPVTLVVARHTHALDEKLEQLRWLLGAVGLAATVAAAFTMFFAVTRGLRPLALLARRIAQIGEGNLSDSIELRDAPGELAAVVLRLNELLARLDEAVRRERGFTADVAHELRTPLGGLESTLSVCLMRRRTSEEYRASAGKCMEIVRSMHVMVDNLLMLARADAGQLKVARSTLEVGPLLDDCWSHFRERALNRRLHVIFDIQEKLRLETDPDKLRIVLNNLFDNAISYCNAGGHVTLVARQQDRSVNITITNTGSRLSDEQIAKIFDRFWRGDGARSGTGTHCGLGLSLSRKIMELLGGAIRASASDGKEFGVTIVLPSGHQAAEQNRLALGSMELPVQRVP